MVHGKSVDGEDLALNLHPQMRGDNRWRVANYETMQYEPVSPTADVMAHQTHESTCPASAWGGN